MSIDIRSCRPDELERLVALLDEEFIFGKGRTISVRLRFPTVYCGDNLPNILLCADGEEIVSALAMRPFGWRADGEIFRGAMIGAVYTRPDRRGKGLASQLLKMAATQLHENKMDFGVLWTGQPSFYARHGWVAADCSVLGKINLDPMTPEPLGDVALLPVETSATRLEYIRQNWLSASTLRHAGDYRQLPLPAEHVNVLWCEEQGKIAYALHGSCGETGFLYELVGDTTCFPALWRGVCRNRQQVFINDRADSPSCRWLTDHAAASWENKNLAMWLPLSERAGMPRLQQWHIPYFDRI